jgi:hypothetical protein
MAYRRNGGSMRRRRNNRLKASQWRRINNGGISINRKSAWL